MNLSCKIQPVKLSQIQVQPLTENEKINIINQAFREGSTKVSSDTYNIFIYQLKHLVNEFLILYDTTWREFNRSFNIRKSVIQKQKKENYSLGSNKGYEQAAINFIRTLEKGDLLLHTIRTKLTGQTISTEFTMVDSKKNITTRKKENVPYTLVLSSYGSSYNNYVSLAYNVQLAQNIKQETSEIYNDLTAKQEEDLEQQAIDKIWQIKNILINKAIWKTAYFDAKDSEILSLITQGGYTIRGLTYNRYLNLRKSLGTSNKGSKQVTSLQSGDIGLTQQKKVSAYNSKVNFARQTFIRNRFQDLANALNNNNPQQLKNIFLNMFTIRYQKDISDKLTLLSNKEAKNAINELFKNLT